MQILNYIKKAYPYPVSLLIVFCLIHIVAKGLIIDFRPVPVSAKDFLPPALA
jgi:hypothetical protein